MYRPRATAAPLSWRQNASPHAPHASQTPSEARIWRRNAMTLLSFLTSAHTASGPVPSTPSAHPTKATARPGRMLHLPKLTVIPKESIVHGPIHPSTTYQAPRTLTERAFGHLVILLDWFEKDGKEFAIVQSVSSFNTTRVEDNFRQDREYWTQASLIGCNDGNLLLGTGSRSPAKRLYALPFTFKIEAEHLRFDLPDKFNIEDEAVHNPLPPQRRS